MEYLTTRNENFLLKLFNEKENKNLKNVVKKANKITEFVEQKEAYIFAAKDTNNYDDLVELIKSIFNSERDYQIDFDSFLKLDFDDKDILKAFVSQILFYEGEIFNKKTVKAKKQSYELLFKNDQYKETFNEYVIIANNRNRARYLQAMPENFCNSEMLAEYVKDDFKKIKNVNIKILNKKQIEDLKMGLILSVNKGSTHEPRVVVLEYNGDPQSKEKLVYVGKGITFDTGGMNTKGYHMEGMKYDMSGSVIVAYALKSIAELNLKANVSIIMMITDNRQDGDASLPENVYESMSGITVEVTDTDAEGRLVLADGLYYGAKVLNATCLVDVATLTGAVLRALGTKYSGVWSTDENNWEIFNKASKNAKEYIWRMPLNEEFNKTNKESIVADLQNWNESGKCDSNHAAMFLKEFTNNVPYIHCDVAGTADIQLKPQGVLVDTLVEFAKLYFSKNKAINE
ncbi:M17 family metallopeptidase [Mycoplasma sp. Mirounga ES2805-ORL]|uniref:M17 family metallopeptidase n=1 Tax=Mycoplasma sp. Mirounga ES2805-ORL TaxID=754514 RepID=UPI00197BB9BF|nr:leucyl aminopeptidase family protein [Mycoplasma sp. Mirounga ES2805-ORL]QSF13928.1 leucyl aminopeptidase family protein [Mycoplasma sp. Mirounga ES2805-ORL]